MGDIDFYKKQILFYQDLLKSALQRQRPPTPPSTPNIINDEDDRRVLMRMANINSREGLKKANKECQTIRAMETDLIDRGIAPLSAKEIVRKKIYPASITAQNDRRKLTEEIEQLFENNINIEQHIEDGNNTPPEDIIYEKVILDNI